MATEWRQRNGQSPAAKILPLQAEHGEEGLPVAMPPRPPPQPPETASSEARHASSRCYLAVVPLATLVLVWAVAPQHMATTWRHSKAVHAVLLRGTAFSWSNAVLGTAMTLGTGTDSTSEVGMSQPPASAGPMPPAVPPNSSLTAPSDSGSSSGGDGGGTASSSSTAGAAAPAAPDTGGLATRSGPASRAAPPLAAAKAADMAVAPTAASAGAAVAQTAASTSTGRGSGGGSDGDHGDSGGDESTAATMDALCPVHYPRMTEAQLRAGERSYLFGAQPPGCASCRRGFNESSTVAKEHHMCEFWSQEGAPEPVGEFVCSRSLQRKLGAEWLARGWTAPLLATPCDLWRFLGPASGFPGRTLWIIGDSQAKALYWAVKCFLHGFVTAGDGAPKERPPFAIEGLDANITQIAIASAVQCMVLGPTIGDPADGRVCFVRADFEYQLRRTVLPLLQAVGSRRDIMVVNLGLHYKEKGRNYAAPYRGALRRFVAWHAEAAGELPYLIWRDTPTQHFDNPLGTWPLKTKPPYECAPIARGNMTVTAEHQLMGTYDGDDEEIQDAIVKLGRGGWRNQAANLIMREAGITVSATYNETAPLFEYHTNNRRGHECTHFCMPSAPQVWLFGLIQTMRAHAADLHAHFGAEELTGLPPAVWPS